MTIDKIVKRIPAVMETSDIRSDAVRTCATQLKNAVEGGTISAIRCATENLKTALALLQGNTDEMRNMFDGLKDTQAENVEMSNRCLTLIMLLAQHIENNDDIMRITNENATIKALCLNA